MSPPPAHRGLLILTGYIAAVLVLGAVLAPPMFWASQGLLHAIQAHGRDKAPLIGGFTAFLAKTHFTSYYNRAALLVALIGVWPLFKAMRLQRDEVLGSVRGVPGRKQLLTGFLLAITLILIMSVICLNLGVFKMAKNPAWGALAMPLLSGLTVAFLEEFLFRGAVLGVLCRSLGARGGMLWTTLIFAIVHFLKPPAHEAIPDAEVAWTSGFWVITQLFSGFGKWQNVIAEFLLLAGVGWVLARVRLATHGLWVGIGLHAGWVAGMKYFSLLSSTTKALKAGSFSPWMVENTCKAIVSPTVGVAPLITVLITGSLTLWIAQRCWPKDPQNPVAAAGD